MPSLSSLTLALLAVAFVAAVSTVQARPTTPTTTTTMTTMTTTAAPLLMRPNNVESGMVLTPFGYWPADCVHGVAHDSHIVNGDREFHVEERVQTTSASSEVSSTRVLRRVTQSRCAHSSATITAMQVAHSAKVRARQQQRHQQKRRASTSALMEASPDGYPIPPDGNGWQVYTKQKAGNVTQFLGV
jgi:hypothetical protein